MRWSQINARRRQVEASCLVCSKPVYEDDPALDFLGIWMHRACFDAPHANDVDPDRRAA